MTKVSKGFFWSFIERILSQGISFIISIILARLIAPDAYGLIVMVTVFTNISAILIEGGFSTALIQKKDRTEDDFCTVFYFNLITSLILFAVLYLLAPYIADFYNAPELRSIVRVLSISLPINSLILIHKVKINLSLNFKLLSIVTFITTVVSGTIGIVLAYNDYEVWALVAQILTSSLLNAILLSLLVRWRPALVFSRESFKELFGFGSRILFNTLITRIYLDIYNVIIGKFYKPSDLAYYNRAFNLSSFASVNIVEIMNRVVYPVECQLQDNLDELKKAFYRYLHIANLLTIPLLALLALLSRQLIIVLLTEKWIGMQMYFILFCINFMMYAWLNQATNIISALGRSDLLFKTMLYRRAISLAILLVTIRFGLVAICIGITISTMIELAILLHTQLKVIDTSILSQIKNISDIFIGCLIMCTIVWITILFISSPLYQLIIGSIVGGIVFIGMIFLFRMPERQFVIGLLSKVL